MGDELDMGVWSEAPRLACSTPCSSLELQRRLQGGRTMKPFVERLRAADSGQGPLGQEPAVCGGALPITGPSGEACSEKQKTKRPHPQG